MSPSRGKVIVAMSGGVDSSVAACLLHEQRYEVTGLFMRTGVEEPAGIDDPPRPASGEPAPLQGDRRRGCCSAADAADARFVAGMLDIPFFVLNFKPAFEQIIQYFIEEYAHGRTPNPCVMCNEQLKFGRLADYGRAAGMDFVATGHYARIKVTENGPRLCRGIDATKDQSYVLYGMDRDMLARTLFPIGGLTKDQVRSEARRFGLRVSDKHESQDICFVPDHDYARLVRERRPELFREGPIVDGSGREVGRHGGIVNFTIGQRRGLGVAAGHPIYVTRLDIEHNTVVVGERDALTRHTLEADRVRWLTNPPAEAFRADVQIRYSHRAAPAIVEPLPGDRVRVRFDEGQIAVTPGQAAVFYDGEAVMGGGWIA